MTFDESIDFAVTIPIELIKDPKGYIEESADRVKDFPNRIVTEVKEAANKLAELLPEAKNQVDAFVESVEDIMTNDDLTAEQKIELFADEESLELLTTANAIEAYLEGKDLSTLTDADLAELSMLSGYRLEFADNGDGQSVLRIYYNSAVNAAGGAILDKAADASDYILQKAQENPEDFAVTLAGIEAAGSLPLLSARIAIYSFGGDEALAEFDQKVSSYEADSSKLQSDLINDVKQWATDKGFTAEEAALYAAAAGVGVAALHLIPVAGKALKNDKSSQDEILSSLEEFSKARNDLNLANNNAINWDWQKYSKGSTGRVEPKNLNERLAMEEVVSKASDVDFGKILPSKLKDSRWHSDDGWVKVQQKVNDINIHFVRNTKTGQVDDFKFKDD